MAVIIVRHGSAGERGSWPGSDVDRPLDDQGRRQASRLPDILDGMSVSRILSSPAARCVQTVEPLARARSVSIEITSALLEGAQEEAVALLRSLSSDDVVLSTHGDIVPLMLDYLARVDEVPLGSDPRWPKGSTWIVDGDGDRYTSARFVPAPG